MNINIINININTPSPPIPPPGVGGGREGGVIKKVDFSIGKQLFQLQFMLVS